MSRYKTLYDRHTKQYFEIKKGDIHYLEIPKLFPNSHNFNFSGLRLYVKNYLTKYCQVIYFGLEHRAYKKIFAHTAYKRKWNTEDIKIIKTHPHLNIEQLRERFFSDVSYNAVAGFLYRLKKQEEGAN